MHLTYRNANDAFRGLVRGINDGSIPTRKSPSRVGEVLQVEEPVTITYTHPLERVLFNPARDANCFFHLFESLHMLAGRNDIAPLAYYAANYAKQVQDGDSPYANGAYGFRWRHANRWEDSFGDGYDAIEVDQLPILIAHLKQNPESRRVVLQMWNVEDDLLKIDTSRDVCCLAGETKFRSPEGEVTIAELATRFQAGSYRYPVYAVDISTGDQRLCWMTNAWKVGVKRLLKITFDDGSAIQVTGDHKLFRKQKVFEGRRCVAVSVEECEARNLTVGDSVLAANAYRVNRGGYREFKRNLFKNTAYRNMQLEHRAYLAMFEPIPRYHGLSGTTKDGHSVHHLDGDKLNNSLTNLQILDNYTHFSHDKFGDENPHNKMSAEAKAARGRKHSAALKEHFARLSPDLRSALQTRKKNRTPEQLELIAEYHASKSNHKIVAIERVGMAPVYDFTVPGRHNAVLSNGIVVHNCNVCAFFSIQHEAVDASGSVVHRPDTHTTYRWKKFLNMTVVNRSNDLVWGALGANVVHFSFLQEYLAACIGCEVGVYNQFTNNLHVYTERWKPQEWLAAETRYGLYENPDRHKHFPLVKDPATFDREVQEFIDNKEWLRNWEEPFLQRVAHPMCWAFARHKARDYYTALSVADMIAAEDWRVAAIEWLERRKANWEKNGSVESKPSPEVK